jgi:predicted DNA-binding transcriptional regulator AlpA
LSDRHPLPEILTREETAATLRLSPRQIDRLARAGKLRKRKLGARRSGFLREDVEAHIRRATEYVSPFGIVRIDLAGRVDQNDVAQRIDALLVKECPGCLVRVRRSYVDVIWHAALGYTPGQIRRSLSLPAKSGDS